MLKYWNCLSYKNIQIYFKLVWCHLYPTKVKNASTIIRRDKNKINNPIKIWCTTIIDNKLHIIIFAKGIIKDRNIKDTFLHIHNLVQLFSEIRSENTQTKKFFSLMTYDITSMYSKYVLGKFQIYDLIRFVILYYLKQKSYL